MNITPCVIRAESKRKLPAIRTARVSCMMLLLALPVALQAQFTYTTNNGTLTITGYTGSGGAVTIPDTIDGLPVTSIGQYAFSFQTSLTNLTIPHGIINIENYAFSQCSGLASASIPNSLTNIGVGAFDSCISLASITIPSGVINIGDYAFSHCIRLPSVTIPGGVISIGDAAFSGCTSLISATIPSSVISIGNRAFSLALGGAYGASGNNSLTTITVDPENLNYSSMDGVLFNKSQTTVLQYPAGKLGTSYTISNSVTSIAGYAFYGCASLTNITIPSSVTELGDDAFAECTNLMTVALPSSVITVGTGAFSFCKSLTNVTLSNGVISIGDYAFYGCASLTDITIPGSVTNIGNSAFVTSTWGGAYGFSGSSRLTAIMVDPENTNYSSAGGVLFNKNQTTIVQYPAGKAETDYTIPRTVTSIGDSAFYGCTSLTNITISGSVRRIEDNAFAKCINLIRATIPDGVTSIGHYTFFACESLANAMIPSSVTSIGHFAFYYCTNLTGLFFNGNAPSLASSDAFDGASNAIVYYLPGTTGWGTTYGGRPTVPWFLPNPVILSWCSSFGVQTNTLGFIISWATNLSVVVEACTKLANPSWSPVSTNTLPGGWSYFSDPDWTNYPVRLYRIRSP
jgi:hypothetical protein